MNPILTWFWVESAHKRLRLYHDAHPSAFAQGKTECCRSGNCCLKGAPRLTHSDLARLAESFGISKGDFFKKYCCVTEHTDGSLSPFLRRHHQTDFAGRYLNAEQTWANDTPCVFYVDGCSVHGPAKPTECSQYQCWTSNNPVSVSWTNDELIALGWDEVTDE